MDVNHHWYTNADGSSKTHRRPRTCEHCREYPKGGCVLPFRKQRKVRFFAKMDNKPAFLFRLSNPRSRTTCPVGSGQIGRDL